MDIKHTHDAFFKTFFSRTQELIPFLESSLPKEVFDLIDPATLTVDSATYIDDDHKEHFSDIAASVTLKGAPAKVYILVEHKSYHDRWALVQILRYMVQTWSRDNKNSPSKPLVPILPILFYHGKSARIQGHFSTLFDKNTPELLKSYQPEFQAAIFNLTALPDSEIKGPPEYDAALWALKYSRTQLVKVFEALERLLHTCGQMFLENPLMEEVKVYILNSTALTTEDFFNKINQILRNDYLKETIMSTAEKLRAAGRQEGEATGRAAGRQEGRQEGEATGRAAGRQELAQKTAIKLLQRGMSLQEIAELTDLTLLEVLDLKANLKD